MLQPSMIIFYDSDLRGQGWGPGIYSLESSSSDFLCNQFANPFITQAERSKPRGDATYFVTVPAVSLAQFPSSELQDFSVLSI